MGFGINAYQLRLSSLLRISLLAALSVAFVGPIGFIGLVSPHISRMLFGEEHRFYLTGSTLTGGLVLSLASIASKSIILVSLSRLVLSHHLLVFHYLLVLFCVIAGVCYERPFTV